MNRDLLIVGNYLVGFKQRPPMETVFADIEHWYQHDTPEVTYLRYLCLF